MKTKRQYIMLSLVATVVAILAASARAYNAPTHRQAVHEAIDYIRDHGTERQREALNQLAAEAGGEGDLRALLGDEAYRTDYYRDTIFWVGSWLVNGIAYTNLFEWDGNYFTRLNHFQNVGRTPRRWRGQDGYYYPWSSRQGEDALAMASWRVDFADIEVDNDFSLFPERYRTHFTGGSGAWGDNWETEIRNTTFSPASAMGYFWYRRYMDLPQVAVMTGFAWPAMNVEDEWVGGVALLGPVLHACGDVTVPHHATGTMALEHTTYENWVEEYHSLYHDIAPDPNLIAEHLARPFLTREADDIPDVLRTIQVTAVTRTEDDASTDADIYLDIGTRKWELNSDRDDFQAGRQDVFTIAPSGVLISDVHQIRIFNEGGDGGAWFLQELYVSANGVLIYGGAVNEWIRERDDWIAPDFVPLQTFARRQWAVDEVLQAAADYTFSYMQNEGAADPRDKDFWHHVFFSAANSDRMLRNMHHLLNLSIALIVRTIEMSQVDRGLAVPRHLPPFDRVRFPSRPMARRTVVIDSVLTVGRFSQPSSRGSERARAKVDEQMIRLEQIRRSRNVDAGTVAAAYDELERRVAATLPGLPLIQPKPAPDPRREPKRAFPTAPTGPALAAVGFSQREFRRRTSREASDPQLSEAYALEAMRYYIMQELTRISVARAFTKAALGQTHDRLERRRLNQRLEALKQSHQELLQQLESQ